MEWKEIFWIGEMKKLRNKFISATDFSRGKAFVKPFGCDETFCINKNGEVLFKTEFHPFATFNEADQIIVYNNESLCGIINNSGKIVIPCKYDYIYQRLGGYTLEKGNTCKKVHFNGETIFKQKPESKIIPFAQYGRTISVQDSIHQEKDGKWGIISVTAESITTIIPFEYDYCDNFFEYELAEVRKSGKCGFVNPKNEIIIPLEYDRVGLFGFCAGICLVEKDGKCGFIDKDNNFVIPLKYGSASAEFIEGLACVEVNEKSETYYKYIFPNDKDAF